MSRSDPQVNFRMPAQLKAKLEAAAAENHRSITSELIARLEASFSSAPTGFFIDEAHRCDQASPERAFAIIEQLKAELIGLTATPK